MLALYTVFCSWAGLVSRRLVQVILENVRKLWNNWEIRGLVLVSLTLQLCLLHFGCRRRYNSKTWLSVFVWLSYLGADSVATVALGVISKSQRNCDDSLLQNDLIAFWAQFMLLHLGGQDTISAFAVQDNELWLRSLLRLVVYSGLALYIILLSWKVSWLSFLTIPLFLAGFVKYAERTWVLKSANKDMSPDDSDYRYMDMVTGREIMSPSSSWGFFGDTRMDRIMRLMRKLDSIEATPSNIKIGIFGFFKTVRCLFLNQKVDLPSNGRQNIDLYSYGRRFSEFRDSHTAWKIIEGELGYAYDVYYTKAPLFFTTWGFFIRTFCFTSVLIVFVLFLIVECHKHPFVDLIVTFLLLVGTILMEIYAVVLLCTSDWPFQRCGKKSLDNCIEALLTPIRSGCEKLTSKQRWSNSMCQLDLLGFCLKDMSLQDGDGTRTLSSHFRGWALYKMLPNMSLQDGDGTPTLSSHFRGWALYKMLPKLNGGLKNMTRKKVSDGLKGSVFNVFLSEREWGSDGFVAKKFHDFITDGTDCVETYQRIIIWHIATVLCFLTDCGGVESELCRDVSKDLSDYMMYILVMLPVVLPARSSKRIFESTCKDVKLCIEQIIEENTLSNLSEVEVCDRLLSFGRRPDLPVYTALLEDKLFPLGIRLANKLKEDTGENSNLWRVLCSFWCENLVHVATLCPGNEHAQLLRNGGEFLTHVWLLEEHFYLSVRARSKAAVRAHLWGRDAAVAAVAAVPEDDAVVSSVEGDDEEEAEVSSGTEAEL